MRTERPYMPGYGVPDDPEGLLPWSWAVERLESARCFWVASADPRGEPHLSAVWGLWFEDALWFSCSGTSRKARNLVASGRCSVATERGDEAVTIRGSATAVTDEGALASVLAAYVAKYGEGFPDPAENPVFAVVPGVVLGFVEQELSARATRWTFAPDGIH